MVFRADYCHDLMLTKQTTNQSILTNLLRKLVSIKLDVRNHVMRVKRIESLFFKELTILFEKVAKQMHPLKNEHLLQKHAKLHIACKHIISLAILTGHLSQNVQMIGAR